MEAIHPLKIGNVTLENNLVLAPMAGVTDLPFRILCKKQGAGLVCTEMVSAKAISYKNKNTEKLMETSAAESPVSLQLFGSEPDILSEIVSLLEPRSFDIIDFNMGCPMPKIVNNGEGSALMKNPKLAGEILSAMVKATNKPVTVKIRMGFDDDNINAVEIAKIAESSGVSAVAVHGRTRQQYYSGNADWNIIRRVKEAVTIPVFGNGDITCRRDIENMYRMTGCDGFMIGRAARGNPWIFHQILVWCQGRPDIPKPSFKEVADMILTHAHLHAETKGEHTAMREMRKHAAWYTSGYPNSAKLRAKINEIETYDELKSLLTQVLSL